MGNASRDVFGRVIGAVPQMVHHMQERVSTSGKIFEEIEKLTRFLAHRGWTVVLLLAAFSIDAKERVIIDTDPGVDDSQAILFAFASDEIEVIGLTSIFGNVDTGLATRNALRLIDLVDANIPVAAGSVRPLYAKKLPTPTFVHGEDGLGEIWVPESSRAALDLTAAEFIVETVMSNPGEISLIALGPMTNIALALALEPRLATSVKRIVAMGGVLAVPGNVSPVASANILGDPHAADIVLGTNWDITLVLADTTRQVKVSDEWLERVRKHGGISGDFIYRASQFYRKFYRSSGVLEGFYNHDPTAVAFFIDESIFSTEKRAIRVVTDGMSIGDVVAAGPAHYKQPGPWYGIPLASVTTAVEADKVMRLIESTLEGAEIRENFDAVQR